MLHGTVRVSIDAFIIHGNMPIKEKPKPKYKSHSHEDCQNEVMLCVCVEGGGARNIIRAELETQKVLIFTRSSRSTFASLNV